MPSIDHRPGNPKPYRVRWRENRKQHSRAFRKKKDAVHFSAALELGQEVFETGTTALAIAAQDWIFEKEVTCSKKTVERYHWVMKDFLISTGAMRLDLVTVAHVETWRNHSMTKMTPYTVRNNIKCLRSFFSWCIARKLCKESPAKAVATPAFKRTIPEWLDDHQTNDLLEKARACSAERYLVAVLASRAGLRASEITLLGWADIDFESAAPIIKVRKTKSKYPRIIPMHPQIKAALMDWPQGGAFLFGRIRKSKDMTHDHRSEQLRKTFCAWLKAEGYLITLHGLRHSFGSQLAAGNTPVNVIAELLGHSSLEVTRLYLHARDRQKVAAVAQLGQIQGPVSDDLPAPGGQDVPKAEAKKPQKRATL
mgnify:CR=1 FL=1